MTVIQMWDKVPALEGEVPVLEYYPAENKKSDATVVIFPGGGYAGRAPHEGKGYAEYLNSIGMDAFVLQYRCNVHHFPHPLADARRAVRMVRARKGLNANVDFYSASVYYSLGIPTRMFTTIFAIARSAGWVAQILEQLEDNTLFRPLSQYTGPDDPLLVPILDMR